MLSRTRTRGAWICCGAVFRELTVRGEAAILAGSSFRRPAALKRAATSPASLEVSLRTFQALTKKAIDSWK